MELRKTNGEMLGVEGVQRVPTFTVKMSAWKKMLVGLALGVLTV